MKLMNTTAPLWAAVLPALATGYIIRLPSPLSGAAVASADIATTGAPSTNTTNIPLLIWHGLGDSFDADGIKSVAALYEQIYPGSSVIAISQGGDSGSADRKATFLGNLTTQVAETCDALLADDAVRKSSAGVNALGFSQGGQFLRGLIERCDGLRVRNLVTFGSQHLGIHEFADCGDGDWWCRTWSGTLRSNTWADFVQANVVPAQYFRDEQDLESYLEHSNFLADINNERKLKKKSYAKNLAALDKFVMILFEDDKVVKPRESSWFAQKNRTSGEVTPLEDLKLYKEDWIGLKALNDGGRLKRTTTPGGHMDIGDGVLEETFLKYFAPTKAASRLQEIVYDVGQTTLNGLSLD